MKTILETNPENYSLDLVRKIGHILLIFLVYRIQYMHVVVATLNVFQANLFRKEVSLICLYERPVQTNDRTGVAECFQSRCINTFEFCSP